MAKRTPYALLEAMVQELHEENEELVRNYKTLHEKHQILAENYKTLDERVADACRERDNMRNRLAVYVSDTTMILDQFIARVREINRKARDG